MIAREEAENLYAASVVQFLLNKFDVAARKAIASGLPEVKLYEADFENFSRFTPGEGAHPLLQKVFDHLKALGYVVMANPWIDEDDVHYLHDISVSWSYDRPRWRRSFPR